MLDQNSIYWGVRLGKKDGDEEYRWYMTRPDPPYLPPPARPQLEAAKPEPQDSEKEGIVIHEVKTTAPTVREERVVHAQGPSAQAFAYLEAVMTEETNELVSTTWHILLQETANFLIDEQGVREVHIDFETDLEVANWTADVFVAMAAHEFLEEGAEPTLEQLNERAVELFHGFKALVDAHTALKAKEDEPEPEPEVTASKEAVVVNLTDEQVEAYGWADELEPAKAKRGLTYWWIYFTIWLKTVFFGGRK